MAIPTAQYQMVVYFLGILYSRGEGVEKDLARAAHWYAKAAAAGRRKGEAEARSLDTR